MIITNVAEVEGGRLEKEKVKGCRVGVKVSVCVGGGSLGVFTRSSRWGSTRSHRNSSGHGSKEEPFLVLGTGPVSHR